MAAAFKIHEDENIQVAELHGNKFKEHKNGSNRCVLGQIQNNCTSENYNTFNYATSKKDIFFKDSNQTTGCTENIKALGLRENDRRKVKNYGKTANNVRSPLKDLKAHQKAVVNKPIERVESPMSVDSPLGYNNKCYARESARGQQSLKQIQSPSLKPSFKDDKHASPMSVDTSPSVSEQESIANSLEDIYCCHVYKEDIYKYLRKLEEEFRPKAYYMKRQPDISYSMRATLVDWLVEVGEEYKLRNETLFMAVSYIDRFLSSMAVTRPKLQLLGTSAMFIAAKFEEIYPPEVGEFTYITDDSYTVKQVLRMERLILKVLSFDLSCPTIYTFIRHISSSKLPPKVLYLAMYICELTLLEADPYLEFSPSLIASGAIALSRHCLDCADIWPINLVKITGYSLLQLKPVIEHLNETHSKSFTLSQTAIRQKYKTPEYENASTIPYKKLIIRDTFLS